jgi:DinB superfamily
MDERPLRDQLCKALDWGEAHVGWKAALSDVPAKERGTKPAGSPHSLWDLLEHVRIAQWDILEFSRNPKHVSPDFPAGYWPARSAPPNEAAWRKSVDALQSDTAEMQKLVADPQTDLLAPIPHGSGQTILRQALLLADHNAYHLGQFVMLRRLLGSWKD